MKFKYQAQNKQGRTKRGIVEAGSRELAEDLLARNGLRIVWLKEVKNIPILSFMMGFFTRIKSREFVIFSRQLATLIDARVPLMSALRSISNQIDSEEFVFIINSLITEIDGGSSFSDALAKYPDTFSGFYINMVKAGEASGTLNKTLNDLADNIEKNYELTAKLRGALYYPAFVLSAMIIVGFLTMTFVIPKLLDFLTETNVKLPIQTRVLMWISDMFSSYWWAIIMVAIVAGVSISYYLKTKQGKEGFDKFILKIPVVNKILQRVYVARFAENLSTLIQSGLPITSSLMITSKVVGNESYRKIIVKAADEIKKGGRIAEVFYDSELIPPVVIQMIEIGEQTGRVDFTLRKIANFYIKETDRMVKNFSSLIEPVLMIFLAIGVGILVSAVLLPIYQVATSIR